MVYMEWESDLYDFSDPEVRLKYVPQLGCSVCGAISMLRKSWKSYTSTDICNDSICQYSSVSRGCGHSHSCVSEARSALAFFSHLFYYESMASILVFTIAQNRDIACFG